MLFGKPRHWARVNVRKARLYVAGLLYLVTACICASPAKGQAWTMPRGEHFLKITGSSITAANQFSFDGRTLDFANGVSGNAFRDESLYLYGELGLFNNLTLVLSLPYKRTFVQDLAFKYETSALGSGTIGVRLALLPLFGARPSALSLALNLATNVPLGYTRNFAPSAGPGQVDVQASLGLGVSFYPTAAYAQISAGYRYRSSLYAFSQAVPCNVGNDINCIRDIKPTYGNELIFTADTGIMFLNGMLFFQALANGVWSVDEPAVGFTAINPIPTLQRYIKAGAGFTLYPFRITRLYGMADLGFGVQYFLTPYGRNTIESTDLFFGIEYRVRF